MWRLVFKCSHSVGQQGRVWGSAVIVCKSVQSLLCKNYSTRAAALSLSQFLLLSEIELRLRRCGQQLAGYLVGIYDTNIYDIECSS